MKPNEASRFSWSGLLFVTSFSFLAFSLFIKIINGSRSHSSLFLKVGLVTLIAAVIVYSYNLEKPKRKRRRSSSSISKQAN